jgi:hypothetical protein
MRTASHRNPSSVPGGVRGPAALPDALVADRTHCGTNASYHAARSIAALRLPRYLPVSTAVRTASDRPAVTAAVSAETDLDGHGYGVRRLEQLFVVRTRRARREDLQLCSPQH